MKAKLSDIQPGRVIVVLRNDLNPLSILDTTAQGDTLAAHVCRVLKSRKIATTGAVLDVLYGEKDALEYLSDKKFFLLETVDPITDAMLSIMEACHDQMMASGMKRLYGIWKLPILEGLGILHGSVSKMGPNPKTTMPEFPICSQAVAYPYWKAGIPIGKELGKQDWTAVTPETFLVEAMETFSLLGDLRDMTRPCYHFRLVNEVPFNGIE